MFYLLIDAWFDWLHAHGLGFLRVFTEPIFQATASILISFLICIAAGPGVIRWLKRQKIGDRPNFDQAEMDKKMEGKTGTPTMGGILIITAIAITTLLLADLKDFYVDMALLCLVWLGGVGAADDWLKLTAGRRSGSRQGLSSFEKLLFQVGISVLLAWFTFRYGRNLPHQLYFPFLKSVGLPLNLAGFVIIATLVMTGSSNAVNLTDGLDGLASGCMAIVSFTFCVLALIVGNLNWASELLIPFAQRSDQMAVLAGAMTGASLGFLWFNCNPAAVFMGDTGSLALGGLIGYIAIVVRQELVLFLVGGIFVAEAVSVMLQVSYFKYTRRWFGEGRRIFLMSPLHLH
ncbi:MAG TPA: phospho-N-acetylmuramoyl-pentapeptide-transferase, partial [Tepidisphaeraceae bacterium]|nr:phospho-N-acetylmuramoyl-pentapeptide-transferase [Tepidisphaeraceae bacterium]